METAKTPLQLIDTSTEVSAQEKFFLLQGVRKFPIHAESASRYSLFFRYAKEHHFTNSDGPVSLIYKKNGTCLELGPCSIITGSGLNGYSGRIVFLHDVYDIESLFSKNNFKKLQDPLKDLPALLARKETIQPSFKEFTSDLTYDLNVYKNLFDNLDSTYSEEPEEVQFSVQKAIIETEGDNFRDFLDKKLKELENIVKDFSAEEHQRHGFYFRKQLWNFLMCCPLIARSNLKPRGYPGDSEMMRMIYLNDYQGESTFSKLMQKHAVTHPAAQSVRNRIKLISSIIGRIRNDTVFSTEAKLKILSIGSGSALELQNTLKTPQDCKSFHFSLLDQDSLALSEASVLIEGIKRKFKQDIDVDFLKYSIRTMLLSRQLKEKLGQFHFIYSMGLFDYFTAPVAKALIKRIYQLLAPGGRMIIGNFHVSNPSRYYMEYWCDWFLIHRTEAEFSTLMDDCPSAEISVFFEDTGSQMFLDIHKHDDEM